MQELNETSHNQGYISSVKRLTLSGRILMMSGAENKYSSLIIVD